VRVCVQGDVVAIMEIEPVLVWSGGGSDVIYMNRKVRPPPLFLILAEFTEFHPLLVLSDNMQGVTFRKFGQE
jgi:hypothetical protein